MDTILRKKSTMLFFTMVSTLFFAGCGFFSGSDNNKVEEVPVARAYDSYLYEEDINDLISPGTSPADSASLAKNYIDNWVRNHVLLHKAEKNLSEDQKDVDKQLNEYRNSLIRFIYEKELIRQQLDTVVTEEEIERYYSENERNFELKDNIVKVLFIRIKNNSPKLKQVKNWVKSGNEKDRLKLEEYSYQFATDFNLDDEQWLLFDEVLKKVPIKTSNMESFLRNNKYVEVEDSTDIYLLKIRDHMIKESISPLSFVSEDIRNMIINKRKLALINEMEKAAYNEAVRNNEFEIYSNE